jgi:hypothetical protein
MALCTRYLQTSLFIWQLMQVRPIGCRIVDTTHFPSHLQRYPPSKIRRVRFTLVPTIAS